MNTLKNKSFWYVMLLSLIGIWLRLIFINKPDGLWNDEYVSWAIATIPFSKSFWAGVASQCHMPFYYLYLKFFTSAFGNSDLMLRLTSVLPGILAIPAMYFLGKEIADKKTGILSATITAFSAFLIYFSQEVRFYEILFLFSALLIIYALKFIKNQSKNNFILLLITNFLVMFTHTLGFIFVFFNIIFVSYMMQKTSEKLRPRMKSLWISFIVAGAIFAPLTLRIL